MAIGHIHIVYTCMHSLMGSGDCPSVHLAIGYTTTLPSPSWCYSPRLQDFSFRFRCFYLASSRCCSMDLTRIVDEEVDVSASQMRPGASQSFSHSSSQQSPAEAAVVGAVASRPDGLCSSSVTSDDVQVPSSHMRLGGRRRLFFAAHER